MGSQETALRLESKQKYKLSVGKVIKIGKACFLVREIGFKALDKKATAKVDIKLEQSGLDCSSNGFLNKPQEVEPKYMCKICLDSDNNEDNPLINPCDCIGSIKYIHLFCMKAMFRSN